MLKNYISLLLISTFHISQAQVEMADDFRGEGKIYVVIGIILIILLGFFFLLTRLDKQAKDLEIYVIEGEEAYNRRKRKNFFTSPWFSGVWFVIGLLRIAIRGFGDPVALVSLIVGIISLSLSIVKRKKNL